MTSSKKINEATIERLAELCCLELLEQEKEKLCIDMEKMLDFASAVSLAETRPTKESEKDNPTDSDRFRDDVVGDRYGREALLSCARTQSEEYITVPRVIADKGEADE